MPLALLTTSAMQRLWKRGSDCSTVNITTPSDENKIVTLNANAFGTESDMSSAWWHEAWANYLNFLCQSCALGIVEC